MNPTAPMNRKVSKVSHTKILVGTAHSKVDTVTDPMIRIPPIVGVPSFFLCKS